MYYHNTSAFENPPITVDYSGQSKIGSNKKGNWVAFIVIAGVIGLMAGIIISNAVKTTNSNRPTNDKTKTPQV